MGPFPRPLEPAARVHGSMSGRRLQAWTFKYWFHAYQDVRRLATPLFMLPTTVLSDNEDHEKKEKLMLELYNKWEPFATNIFPVGSAKWTPQLEHITILPNRVCNTSFICMLGGGSVPWSARKLIDIDIYSLFGMVHSKTRGRGVGSRYYFFRDTRC